MNQPASNNELALRVTEHMTQIDGFSRWMGLEILSVEEGYCLVKMKIRPDMLNGFGIAHGGLAFSMADSAFAFACNSRNNLSVALDVNISYIKAVQEGDTLTAEAKEVHNGRSTGVYQVEIWNQLNEKVALFKGTCFRTGKPLI